MTNPVEVIRDLVVAAPKPVGTTHGTAAPTGNLSAPYVQYAWDGTPSDADNRENTAIRVTVWTAKGQNTLAAATAADLRAYLLAAEHESAWRVDRGSGRLLDQFDLGEEGDRCKSFTGRNGPEFEAAGPGERETGPVCPAITVRWSRLRLRQR